MEYTKEQIEGSTLQLILDKVNSVVKPLEEDLIKLVSDSNDSDLIKIGIDKIIKTREETFAMYGVKPQRLRKITNAERAIIQHQNADHQWFFEGGREKAIIKSRMLLLEEVYNKIEQDTTLKCEKVICSEYNVADFDLYPSLKLYRELIKEISKDL